MLKICKLHYQTFFRIPPDKFLYQFYADIYNFCLFNGYTFIAYVHPEDESMRTSVNTFSIKKSKMGYNLKTQRKMRILISSKGLQYKPLLDIREFNSFYPGFVFSVFDDRLEQVQQTYRKFSFFETDVIIPLEDWHRLKKQSTGSYMGVVRYRDNKEIFVMINELREYLKMSFDERQKWKSFKKNKEKDRMYYRTESEGDSVHISRKIGKSKIQKPKNNAISTLKKDFCHQVSDQVEKLSRFSASENSALKKIVISKLKIVTPPSSFNHVDFFFRLVHDFQYSFVNTVSGPDVGTWMGASPEILVKRDVKKIFKTVSLAGTQWLNPKSSGSRLLGKSRHYFSQPLHSVSWTQKEIEEQAITSRFIIDCFKQIRLREYQEEGPVTVRKGNLLHLQSTFTVNTNRYYGDTLPYEMIALLHPTPAVCGMPNFLALQEIRKVEKHDRRFYAGYMGPVEIDNSIDIYVNLRCLEWMKIQSRRCCGLYAGAGINRFSIPKSEWQETEAKLQWLLDGIKSVVKKY